MGTPLYERLVKFNWYHDEREEKIPNETLNKKTCLFFYKDVESIHFSFNNNREEKNVKALCQKKKERNERKKKKERDNKVLVFRLSKAIESRSLC